MTDISLNDSELQDILSEEGPFSSLYLSTQASSESAAHEIALRWRGLRDGLGAGGYEKDLAALEELIEGAHQEGEGLVAFAAQGRVLYRRHLAYPIADSLTAGPLPHLLPLAEWRQEHPAYAVVLATRGGAEIHVVRPEAPDRTVSVEGDAGTDVQRTASGGSERNLQHRAERLAEENAGEVADAVRRIAGAQGIELVLLTGDAGALGYLRAQLSDKSSGGGGADRMEENLVEVGGNAGGGTFEDSQQSVEEAVSARAALSSRRTLERLREGRGQMAAEGTSEVLEALRKAQVDTLVIAGPQDERRAWFSPQNPGQAALDRETLADLGMDDATEAPLLDVLLHAAYSTGAGVRVAFEVPMDEAPADGLGAILRYS